MTAGGQARFTAFDRAVRRAVFNRDRTHRYLLQIPVCLENVESRVCFCMLNPSVADEDIDDATIRRCKGYAVAWGYRWLDVVNLFSLISTNPAGLDVNPQAARGNPDNLERILATFGAADLIIAAWGANVVRSKAVAAAAAEQIAAVAGKYELHCLGTTTEAPDRPGQPLHPLRLAKALKPRLWVPPAVGTPWVRVRAPSTPRLP